MIPITASLALIITAFGLASANPIAPRTLTIPLIKSSTKSQISSKDVVARDKSRIAKYNGVQSHVGAQTVRLTYNSCRSKSLRTMTATQLRERHQCRRFLPRNFDVWQQQLQPDR